MFGSMLGNRNVQALMLNLLHGALTPEQVKSDSCFRVMVNYVEPGESGRGSEEAFAACFTS